MLPKLLTSRLETILGEDYSSVMDAFSKERKGSFRINALRSNENEVLEELKTKWILAEPYPHVHWVYLFSHEHDYTIKGTDAFYKGKIYLQSLASMLPVLALEPKKGEHILDVCAAPGSKTTQMAMLMENEGQIIALEQNQIRFDKLMYNAKLQGATIIEWIKMDARKFLSGHCEEEQRSNPGTWNTGLPRFAHASLAMTEPLFDRILLDAPCSAEWRISLENEKSYGFWTLENIRKKAELQYELLSLAVGSLKQWWTLVYSTCTLAPEENEWVISKILQEHPEFSLEPIEIGLSEKSWWKHGITRFGSQSFHEAVKDTVRILPSNETEGFYMAKIVKH